MLGFKFKLEVVTFALLLGLLCSELLNVILSFFIKLGKVLRVLGCRH